MQAKERHIMTEPETDAVDEIIEAWRRERPDLPLEATAVVSRIWHLARLLSTLRRSGPPYRLTTRELSERSLVTAGAISQRLTRAERNGLVTRETARDGSRQVQVTLTAAGIETVNRYVDVVMNAETQALSGIPGADLETLSNLLRQMMLGLIPESRSVPRRQVGQDLQG
jgi:DNA-binding MarR family transcriptional regulator